MANYSYIDLPQKLSAAEAEALIKRIVKERFGDRVTIEKADWNPESGCTHAWEVCIPGSEVLDRQEARRRWIEPGEVIGFSIQRKRGGDQLVFRHGPSVPFVFWFRGCIAERIARHFKVGIYYDATDEVVKRGPKHKDRYDYPTYCEYLTRNFDKPLSKDDREYLEKYKDQTPEGWWTGF